VFLKGYMIIRYFASWQKRQKYNWRIIANWAFQSSVPISKENKAAGIIADTHTNLIRFWT
jgi:hypothetical protein